MTQAISPKSGSGSLFWSILAHGVLYGGLVVALNISFAKKEITEYVSLDMQEFDSPPVPEKKEQRVKSTPKPVAPAEASVRPDNTPKELQDEKSDVTGTQAANPEVNTGTTPDGNAASTPYYKVKPKYPKAAWLAQLEGWVLLQIDITETGEVENIRVVAGEQRNMFEGEAKRAVLKYKYKPFTDASGQPYRKTDHQVRVNFRIADEESGS